MAIYMKVNGIAGQVTAKGFSGWIECLSCEHGLSRSIHTAPGQTHNRENAQPSFSEITLTKQLDKASPHLFQQACTGKAVPHVEINVCQTSDSITPYLKYSLSNVIISQRTVAMGLDEQPIETLQLNFTKIEETYIERNAKNRLGSPISAGYDLAEAASM